MKMVKIAIIVFIVLVTGFCADNIGELAEQEAKNHNNPEIESISSDLSTLYYQSSTKITVKASDKETENLTYTYEPTNGTITGSGNIVTFTSGSSKGPYYIKVTVSDGAGGEVTRTHEISFSPYKQLSGSFTSKVRSGAPIAVYNDKAYVFDGIIKTSCQTVHREAHSFDLSSSTVTQLGQPTDYRAYMPAVVVSDTVYLLSGYNFYNGAQVKDEVIKYNITSEAFSSIAANNSFAGVYYHSAVGYNTDIYLFGGYNSAYSDKLWKYNTTNDQWSEITTDSPPTTLGLHGAAIIDDDMYVFGGYTGSAISTTLYKYNITSDTWSTVDSDFPGVARYGNTLAASGQKLYVFGGKATSPEVTYLNEMWEYDIAGDTWTKKTSLPASGRFLHSVAEYNNKIIIYGGREDTNQTHFDDLWIYDPAADS